MDVLAQFTYQTFAVRMQKMMFVDNRWHFVDSQKYRTYSIFKEFSKSSQYGNHRIIKIILKGDNILVL